MSDISTFLRANRRNWDERVPIHRRDRNGFYAIERFFREGKPLRAMESGELGDVAGQRVIHLQCHFGLDTLALARQGAIVTGLDFSPAAIDTPAAQPLVFDEPQTYTGDPTRLVASRTYQWIHSLSRLVNALIGAGLTLEFLHEHPTLPWPMFPMYVRGADGLYRLPDGIPAFPLSVSLRARKPTCFGRVG